MKVLVTGAAGFLGARLIRYLLDGPAGLPRVDAIVAADVAMCPVEDPRVEARLGTILDPPFVRAIVDADVELVYHLAAVLSGQAESDFDLGMRVNVDATRMLLEACRRLPRPPRVIFSSTIAVFGGPLPAVVPENLVPRPQSSYGAGKAIAEVLVAEYSRRGFIDGLVLRVPTVAIRPGAPNSAMSSFVSGIVREPLAGVESVCPVPVDTRLWISSPGVVTRNLAHAARVNTSELEGPRTLNLPGLSVTPAEVLGALERQAGPGVRARVRVEIDPRVASVVCSWPGAFDVTRPLALGFLADADVDAIVREFISAHAPDAVS